MAKEPDAPLDELLTLHFVRVRRLLLAGVFTLGSAVTVLGLSHADPRRLLIHLAVCYLCVPVLALAAYGRLLPARRTAEGLPVTFVVMLTLSHLWAGSAVLVDYASAADEAFLLHNTLVLLAGSIGLIMTAGPIARPTQLAFVALFLPTLVVTALQGLWPNALAVVVFLALVVGSAIPKINGTFRELFELRQQAAAMAERERLRALTDDLTALPNRRGTTDRYQRDPGRFAWVLYLDLDRFKEVNDTGGHAVGDQVLIAVARRLVAAAPAGGVVGRMGGDEFVMLLPIGSGDVAELIAVIDRSLSAPIPAGDRSWEIGVSIGRAPLREDRAFEVALQEADEKMFLRKAARRIDQPRTVVSIEPIEPSGSVEPSGPALDPRR
ncbi:MAG: GGDEF domain-containing protein [Actinomycetota bacterium]